MFQVGWIALEFRVDLQHHHVLVALGVDDRDLPLRERVVEALSMSCTRTPRLEAFSRSTPTSTSNPPGPRSLDTSVMPPTVSIRLPTSGPHFCNRSRSV